MMRILVTEATGQLDDLVRRAEAGDEVILLLDGHAAVQLVPVAKLRRTALEAARKSGARKACTGPTAARSQDFLYDDDHGLPK